MLRYDGSQPTGSPQINGGAGVAYSLDLQINPNGQDTGSGLATVRLSNDGTTWQAQPYGETLSWTLPLQNRALHTVHLEIEDGAGNRSTPYVRQVCLDLYPAHPASAGYRLWSAGPTAAGGRLASAHFQVDQTAGQSSAGGRLAGVSYMLQSGFQTAGPAMPGAEMFTVFHCGGGGVYLPLITRGP